MGNQLFQGTKRLNGFIFEPEDLVIIGLDTDNGPEHPLYDERIHLPLDEGLIKNIMLEGVIKPVVVCKDPDGHALVVDGRQRVRAAREAKTRQAANGDVTVRVPAVHRRSDETALLGVSISANGFHQGTNVLAKARQAERLLNMGQTEEEVALRFGVSGQAIRNWRKLLDLAAELKKAVEAGKIAPSAALELAKLPKAEQKAALQRVISEHGETRTRQGKRKRPTGKQLSEASGGQVALGKRVLKRVVQCDLDEHDVSPDIILGIQFALGMVNVEQVPGMQALVELLQEEAAAKHKRK